MQKTPLIKVEHPEFKRVFLTIEKSTLGSASLIKFHKEQGNQVQVDKLIKESFYKDHDDSEYLLAVEKSIKPIKCKCGKEFAIVSGGMISVRCRSCNEKLGIDVVGVSKQ